MALGIWAIFLVGCAPHVAAPSGAETPAAKATLRIGDEHDLATLLRQAQGQVVLVDFWATWCGSCVELLPHTLALAERHAAQGFQAVTVSFDAVENKSAVQGVLSAQHAKPANIAHLLSRYGAGTRSVEAFAAGEGVLPCLKLFDRRGQLHATFGGDGRPIDPQALDRAVARLLAR